MPENKATEAAKTEGHRVLGSGYEAKITKLEAEIERLTAVNTELEAERDKARARLLGAPPQRQAAQAVRGVLGAPSAIADLVYVSVCGDVDEARRIAETLRDGAEYREPGDPPSGDTDPMMENGSQMSVDGDGNVVGVFVEGVFGQDDWVSSLTLTKVVEGVNQCCHCPSTASWLLRWPVGEDCSVHMNLCDSHRRAMATLLAYPDALTAKL